MAISAADFRAMKPARSTTKYGNKKVIVEGERFDSKKEAERWRQLRLLESAGRIRNLRRQVSFQIRANDALICRYIADFVYDESDKGVWRVVCEDSKGYPTPIYKLKKRMMKVLNGIEVRET